MSKIIKLTPQYIAECTKEFQESLSTGKFADGKISFSKTLGSVSRKATIYFTDLAWMKMQTLISEFDKEVAWHGVASRGDDETKDEYFITDILVYPQEVSGASVEMDVAKYDEWIRDNIEDERFFRIGMQGHSHVRMGVTPSGVDLTHQEAILDQLTDDMFYIFMIWNKLGAKNIKIYDLAKNVLFETADIEVEVLDDGYGVDAFIKEAKDMVKERIGYNSYNRGGSYAGYTSGASAITPATTTTSEDAKKETTNKRKGKRKNDKNKKTSTQISAYGYYDDDWPPYNGQY